MQSTGARIGVVVAAAAVIIVLFLVLNDDEDGESGPASTTSVTEEATEAKDGGGEKPKPKPEPEPAVAVTEIEVKGGQPVGGVKEIEIESGAKAEIVVTSSDTTEEVHLHGYDISAELAPGEPAKIEFDATIDGVFEMELEESVTPIAEVTVRG